MGRSRGKLISAALDVSFVCELGLALGKTLAEVWALSAAEISVWLAYRRRYGFPVDRLTNGVAAAGAYVGATMGGKARASELIPRFSARVSTPEDAAGVKAWFERLAGKK